MNSIVSYITIASFYGQRPWPAGKEIGAVKYRQKYWFVIPRVNNMEESV